MMKSKALKICLCALLLLVCLTVTPTAVRAEDHSALHPKRAAVNLSDDMRSEARDGEAVYTNPDTNYRIVILDKLNLLTNTDEASLAEVMKPITQYGNIIPSGFGYSVNHMPDFPHHRFIRPVYGGKFLFSTDQALFHMPSGREKGGDDTQEIPELSTEALSAPGTHHSSIISQGWFVQKNNRRCRNQTLIKQNARNGKNHTKQRRYF